MVCYHSTTSLTLAADPSSPPLTPRPSERPKQKNRVPCRRLRRCCRRCRCSCHRCRRPLLRRAPHRAPPLPQARPRRRLPARGRTALPPPRCRCRRRRKGCTRPPRCPLFLRRWAPGTGGTRLCLRFRRRFRRRCRRRRRGLEGPRHFLLRPLREVPLGVSVPRYVCSPHVFGSVYLLRNNTVWSFVILFS